MLLALGNLFTVNIVCQPGMVHDYTKNSVARSEMKARFVFFCAARPRDKNAMSSFLIAS